jgi:hypothetical protein
MNLEDKDRLDMPWDVHAARLVSCGDCHYSRHRPERTAGDVAVGSVTTPEGNRRRCDSCHSLTGTHSWLPEQEKHFEAVACESCHVPQLQMAAQQSIDATVARPDGTPRSSYRGVNGNVKDASTAYIQGYTPLLRVGSGVRGDLKVLPYNLVTRWFWVDKVSGREVTTDIVARAWINAGAYDKDIMLAFDANRNEKLEDEELRLDDAAKVVLIKERLRVMGVKNPEIKGEIRPYHIHHNVRHGDQVNRDCTRCHIEDKQVRAAFTLSPYQPDNVQPTVVTNTTNIVLDGDFVTNSDGALQFIPEHDVVESYKILKIMNKHKE